MEIDGEMLTQLQTRLQEADGFKSYREIQQWIEQTFGKQVKYKTVHKTVRYRLKAKLKVPRPLSLKQNQQAVSLFKNIPRPVEVAKPLRQGKRLRYLCQDETRVGLKSETGKVITEEGIKPIAPVQWLRDNFWSYVVEPLSGWHFQSMPISIVSIFSFLDAPLASVGEDTWHSSIDKPKPIKPYRCTGQRT